MESDIEQVLRRILERQDEPTLLDPTANVLEHVRSGLRRVDEIAILRASHQQEVAQLRALHQRELDAAEKERLNAIREIDAQAISLADQKLNALGDRLQQSFSSTVLLLDGRISELQRSQYEFRGAKTQEGESRQQTQWAVGVGLAILGVGIAAAGAVIGLSV